MELNIYENANMTLRTVNASTADANNSSFVWNNVDMRKVLGQLYDNHDTFRIILNSVTSKNQSTITDNDESCLVIQMSGLPFERNTYNYVTKTESTTAVIGCMKLTSTSGYITNSQLGLVFRKIDGMHNIGISLKKAISGTSPTSKVYGDFSFHFTIYAN